MITIIVFIALKLAEIVGVFVICFICHRVGYVFITHEDDDLSGVMFMRISLGALTILGVSLGMLLLYYAIIANWEWAVKLSQ